MRYRPVKIAALMFGLGGSVSLLATSNTNNIANNSRSEIQMGFYDLLSHKKEIYDVRLTSTNGAILSTITNPNDNRFIFKGKFTIEPARNQQLHYKYTPIFYNNPTSGRMIDGFMDYLIHNNIMMTPMMVENQPLIYGLSGIFLDNVHGKKEGS